MTKSEVDYKNSYEEEFMKDCKGYDVLPPILPAKRRIIVIGDIHGDYKLTVECLKLADVIESDTDNTDDEIKWTTGINKDTYVIQIGDQVDRCRPYDKKCDHPDATVDDEGSDIKILKLFTNLDKQARKHGGRVISLLGNHEIMNVDGNLNYVSYKGLEQFKDYKDPDTKKKKIFKSGAEGRKYAFARGNEYARYLACTRLSAIIIGNFIFVHAGIVPEFTTKLNITGRDDLYKINYMVRKWLLKLINDKYVDKIVNSSPYSMFWDRILGAIPPNINNEHPKCAEYLTPVLDIFEVGKMFVGHTPQSFKFKNENSENSSENNSINATCNDRLWRVDNGASKAFNKFDKEYMKDNKTKDSLRTAQILEIIGDDLEDEETQYLVLN